MVALITIVVVLLLLIPLYFYQKKKAAERTQAMRQIATALGWAFYDSQSLASLPGWEQHFLFSQGRGQQIYNMLAGDWNGVRAALFDYRYTTGHGRSTQTHHQTVAYFQSGKLRLPQFSLRPEGFGYKLIAALGYQDIDFPTHPVFSSKYLLRGPDEAAIRQTFNERVLTYFDHNLKLWVDGTGQELFVYQMNTTVRPENLRAFLDQGAAVLNIFQQF